MIKIGDKEALERVGGAESRDGEWAGSQLQIILHDPWFQSWISNDTQVIEPGDLMDNFGVEDVKNWARQDSANSVPVIVRNTYPKNYRHRIGIESVVGEDTGWNSVRGMEFARSVAAEIFARAGGDAINEHVIQFLIPGIGLSGAKDVLGMLRNRDLVLREDQPNGDIFRIRDTH